MDYIKRRKIPCIKLCLQNFVILILSYIILYISCGIEPIEEALYFAVLLFVLIIQMILFCKIKEEKKYDMYITILLVFYSFALTLHTTLIYLIIFIFMHKKNENYNKEF